MFYWQITLFLMVFLGFGPIAGAADEALADFPLDDADVLCGSEDCADERLPRNDRMDSTNELEAIKAAERAEFGPTFLPTLDSRDYDHLEGMKENSREKALRQDQLLFELSSRGIESNRSRPGGPSASLFRGIPIKGFDIPVIINEPVERFIAFLQGRGREMFHRWLARTSRYFPLMKEIFRKYELPEDLVSVALIESGLNYKAFSPAKASGPWQFIQQTGSRYGLKVDLWQDERRDFYKATDAAARHLRDLYDKFGDWYLAWAAYNAGEGKISRAIERTQTNDFWNLISSDELQEETKRYVPRIIAAALISKNPEHYGFSDVSYQAPLEWEEVEIHGFVNLRDAAKAIQVDQETLHELNPELRYWCSPPHLKSYRLRIPKGTAALFEKNVRPNLSDPTIGHTRHEVRSGENLQWIATRYGLSPQSILKANHLTSARRVRPGIKLLIPLRPCEGKQPTAQETPIAKSTAKSTFSKPAGKTAERIKLYTVQPGDSLWGIAKRLKTDIKILKKKNKISENTKLKAGTTIRVD